MFTLTCEVQPHWPPLAWVAESAAGENTVKVRHGCGVETTLDWCCEAVWAGDYAAGDSTEPM